MAVGNLDVKLEIDSSYGFKLEYLLEGCTKHMQQILRDKYIEWNEKTNLDFFDQIQQAIKRKWTGEEMEKIGSRDFSKWDMSLCTLCLLNVEFWGTGIFTLSTTQNDAIVSLRNVRNYSKHLASPRDVTETQFYEKCKIVEDALLTLGANPAVVKKLLETSQNRISADKTNINEIVEQWQFTTVDILGSGSCGIVIAGKDNVDLQTYAIKLIPNRKHNSTREEEKKYFREASNWSRLKPHSNVVKYLHAQTFMLSKEKIKQILNWDLNINKIGEGACEYLLASFAAADMNKTKISGFYIKTELCGKTLREWLTQQATNEPDQRFDQSTCLKYGKNIMDGLYYIHTEGIIHRDLRPNNIFFSKPHFLEELKIGDFGLSNRIKLFEHQTQTKDAGDSLYRAPEVGRLHKDGKAIYSQAADLFSLGLIISELFDPVLPDDLKDKFNMIIYSRDTGPIEEKIPSLHKFILTLTDKKYPNQRYMFDAHGNPQWMLFPVNQIENFGSEAETNISTNDVKTITAATLNLQLHSPKTSLVEDESSPHSSHYTSAKTVVGALNANPQAPRPSTNSSPRVLSPANLSPRNVSPAHIGLPTSSKMTSPVRADLAPEAKPTNIAQSLQLAENGLQSDASAMLLQGNPPNLRTINDEGIVDVRKLAMQNKSFWTPENVAKFFSEIEGTNSLGHFNASIPTKSKFNSKIYGLRGSHPNLVTEINIIRVLCYIGFPEMADALKSKWRIP